MTFRVPSPPAPALDADRHESATSGHTGKIIAAFFALLVVGSWVFVFSETGSRNSNILSVETLDNAWLFLQRLAGVGDASPAFLDGSAWVRAFGLAYDTLAMSVLAIGMAAIGALLTVGLAARRDDDGSIVFGRGFAGTVAYGVIRASYIVSRAVPELIWAMLIVFILAPGILPAAVALALHNYGILGKLCAEVIEDTDPRAPRALRAAGASGAQTLIYAVFPMAVPYMLTYFLYRWEVIIRATIIVGFVSASGLGREFRLSMSFFHYTDVALLLIIYFILVVSVDLLSAGARRMIW